MVVVVVVVVSLQVDVLLSTCSSTMALTRSALFICIVGDASMISSIFSWYERLLTENVLSGWPFLFMRRGSQSGASLFGAIILAFCFAPKPLEFHSSESSRVKRVRATQPPVTVLFCPTLCSAFSATTMPWQSCQCRPLPRTTHRIVHSDNSIHTK